MTLPRITIIGSALSGNKGAAAMLESAIANLGDRIPGVQFSLLSMYPEEDAALNVYPNLSIIAATPKQLGVTINTLALLYRILPPLRPVLRKRSRAIKALTESSVLIDQGGITFNDGREKFLLYNVASILPALFVKTPVFKCAQAIGPFKNPLNKFAARMFLPKVSTIVTRGAITHQYAEDFGLKNIVAGTDFAFGLQLSGTEEASLAKLVNLAFFENTAVVGISPSVVVQKKVDAAGGHYVADMVKFIDELNKRGEKVAIIPHSVRMGTDKTHNNDLPLCREIYNSVSNHDLTLFADSELTSQELRVLIGKCQVFIACRFHAMISSLAMGVPTLVIGWSHKYREVLDLFDLSEWAMGFDTLNGDTLMTKFNQLKEQREEVAAALQLHRPAVKSKALEQADLIAAYVKN